MIECFPGGKNPPLVTICIWFERRNPVNRLRPTADEFSRRLRPKRALVAIISSPVSYVSSGARSPNSDESDPDDDEWRPAAPHHCARAWAFKSAYDTWCTYRRLLVFSDRHRCECLEGKVTFGTCVGSYFQSKVFSAVYFPSSVVLSICGINSSIWLVKWIKKIWI